jgi:hypothetical protein
MLAGGDGGKERAAPLFTSLGEAELPVLGGQPAPPAPPSGGGVIGRTPENWAIADIFLSSCLFISRSPFLSQNVV